MVTMITLYRYDEMRECEDILHIPSKGAMQQTDNAQRTANAPPYATA